MKIKEHNIDLIIYITAIQYILRQNGTEKPAGSYDDNEIFYPDPKENLDTSLYPKPNKKHPLLYLNVCKSLGHIAKLNNYTSKKQLLAIKRAVEIYRTEKKTEVDYEKYRYIKIIN